MSTAKLIARSLRALEHVQKSTLKAKSFDSELFQVE